MNACPGAERLPTNGAKERFYAPICTGTEKKAAESTQTVGSLRGNCHFEDIDHARTARVVSAFDTSKGWFAYLQNVVNN